MENRLPNVQRLLLILAGLFIFCNISLAQAVDITFEYSGPDTILVGPNCTAPLDWGAPTSVGATCNTTGCVVTSLEVFFISGGYAENDPISGGTTVTVTYRVNYNNNGQLGSLTIGFDIDFVDNTSPVFDLSTLPSNVSYDCLAEVPMAPTPTATDNCPSPGGGATDVVVTYDGQNGVPTTCDGGSFTRSWTATDLAGNETTYTQTITVSGDTNDPTITGIPSGAVELCESADYAAWLAAQRAAFSATDGGCGLLELTDNAPAIYDADCSSIDITFTATDSCSNSETVLVTYAITDNTNPQIVTPAVTDITLQCTGIPTDPTSQIMDWQNNLTVTDNCTAPGDIIWSNTFTALTGGCGGATGTATVSYYAEDLCGNRDTLTLDFTVLDSNDPDIITGAVDTTVLCDGAGNTAELADWLLNRGYADAVDVCTDATDISLTLRINNNIQTPAQVQDTVDMMMANGCGAWITVEFAFTDLCGNTSTTNADFVVLDTLAPMITAPAQMTIVECDNPSISFADWMNSRGGAMASDNCATIDNSSTSTNWTSNIVSDVPGTCFNESTRTVAFTVTDQCGLTSTTTAQYIVEDNGSPTIMPTATDLVEECGGGNDQTVLNTWINNFAGASASDVCSNITWDVISYTTSTGVVDTDVSFGDNTNYPQVVANDCDWSVEVTFTVIDDCENSSTTMASFFMIDQIDPVLAGVNAVNDTLYIDCDAPISGFPAITASDNCAANVNITVDSTQMELNCLYSFVRERIWTATDDCNNTSTIRQVLIVQDTTKPFLTGLPLDMTVSCDAVPAVPMLNTDFSANDNCDVMIDAGVSFNEGNGQGTDPDDCSFYNYSITRTWTVTDVCGNANIYTQTISVEDTAIPTFTVPADTVVDCHVDLTPVGTGNATNLLDVCDADPTLSFVDVFVSGTSTCPNAYTIERTWSVVDACGNASIDQTQIITVQDTLSPIFTTEAMNVDLECTLESAAQDSFVNWVNAFGNSVAADLCTAVGDLSWFAAVPGSYNVNDPTTWPGTAPGGLSTAVCPSPVPGVYRSETVDFVVYDECENANSSSAIFNVIDTEDPAFDNCPSDATATTDAGECYSLYALPAPVILDGCNAAATYNITETEAISSSSPGDDNVPVNTVVISFSNLPAPPVSAIGDVSLDLDFTELDGEQPTEFFNIFGDDGSFLGTTDNTTIQCGSVTTSLIIPSATFNAWAADGEVNISLVPNIPAGQPGIFSINDICPDGSGTGGGSEVEGTLDFAANNPNGIIFQYDVNGGTLVTVDPIGAVVATLFAGENDITYYATDCAGNVGTCTFTIEIEDNEDPTIVCPADVVYDLAADEGCGDVDIQMEIPTMISDNCPFNLNAQTQPNNTDDGLLTFTYNPNYLEYVADDKDFTFVGTAANAVGSVATFTVTIIGDADDAEEYFTIYGEDGSVLGTTEVGQTNVTVIPANCPTPGQTIATFTVPVALFNTWAADGSVDVTAESNDDFIAPPSGGPDDGINPSCVLFPTGTADGETDNVSSIFIALAYESATVSYYTTGATVISQTDMLPPAIAPIINFDKGDTEVFYTVSDNAGNEVSCSFTVSVNDVLGPVIDCDATTIFVNPSGLEDYELEWYEIENGSDSYDENCEIDNYNVSPNTFDCSMVDQAFVVTLTATDDSGNTSTCTSLVSIEVEQPEPEYSIGLCGDDNLYLVANPPNEFGQFVYTYTWYNPSGVIISTDEDPVIPGVDASDSGSYMVELEGLTGCTAFGIVNVIISDSPNLPNISANETNLCENEELVLTTQSYSGTSVEYKWYTGIAPNGTLLDSTTIPQYTIPAPLAVGSETYYVVVEVDGCLSDASFFETVTVGGAVIATTNTAVINICEGEDIILGTSVAGTGLSYQWTGPNGFTSNSQFPQVISNAGIIADGTYNLTIISNGCESNIATTVVNVTASPQTPIVSTTGVACLGDNITLLANINGADMYTWVGPDFSETITATNTLTLTNVTTDQTGNWSLYVTNNGCVSETSSSVSVFVEPTLTVVASNDGPICEGSDVQLLVNSIPGATYIWTGPAGFNSASQNPITTAVAGMYAVTVTSSTGCSNTTNTAVAVSEAPTITALSNTGAPCVTGADDILLVPTVFPPDDGFYTYSWDGPNGFVSTDVNPLLPNGTSIDNGSYVLVVTNGAGCISNAVTTVVNVSDAPETPLLDAPVGLCEGSTLTLTTTGYVGSSVTYTWMTPLGTITTNIPSLTVPNATASSTGTYNLLVTVDGCTSNPSSDANIIVSSVPSTPTIVTNSPVCEGETINLETEFIANAEYQWTGPANFNSSLYNPAVFTANADDAGTYQVQVIIDGCPSVFSVPVNVNVNAAPTSAIAVNNGPICIDDAGTTLLLSITPSTALPGASYSWYDAQTNALVAGPTSSLNATILDFTNYEEGLFDFYVVTTLNGCSSFNSIPTTVEMNVTPQNEAFAGEDIIICTDQSVSLSATAPTTGEGSWIQLSGPSIVIVNPNSPTTPLSGISEGNSYTFLWSLSNGACGEYSSDEVIISVSSDTEQAVAGSDLNICNETTATLSATAAGANSTGLWTQTPAQAALGIIIIDPTDPNTTINGMEPGNNYSFIWNLSNNGCGEFAADEMIIEIEESNVVAIAPLDFSDCGGGDIELVAEATTSGLGTWSSNTASLNILNPNNRITTVSGLATGVYTFFWTLDNGSCGTTMDSVVVDYEAAPIAFDDVMDVEFAGQNSIDVTINDDISGGFTIALTQNSINNASVTNPGGGEFLYVATNIFAGLDSFTYKICSDICPDECSTATVVVRVGENAACATPSIFTPNNDGVNDAFIIPCLATDRYPSNVVSIFNQWGDEVFRSSPYRNTWEGTYNGDELPVGTYFYVIEFGNGEDIQSGFLILER